MRISPLEIKTKQSLSPPQKKPWLWIWSYCENGKVKVNSFSSYSCYVSTGVACLPSFPSCSSQLNFWISRIWVEFHDLWGIYWCVGNNNWGSFPILNCDFCPYPLQKKEEAGLTEPWLSPGLQVAPYISSPPSALFQSTWIKTNS